MKVCCKCCGKTPSEIGEYTRAAEQEDMSPEEFVQKNEGTYNPTTGKFYCTACYIKMGMPLGRA